MTMLADQMPNPFPPEDSGGTRLQTKQERNREIARRYLLGESVADLASEAGVTTAAIYKVVSDIGVKRPKALRYYRPDLAAEFEARKRRDEEIVAKYLSGIRTPQLEREYGITRERVCQILRRGNVISLVAERKRLAKEELKKEVASIKDAVKRERDQKFEIAISLVRDGASINEASAKAGLTRNEINLFGRTIRRLGIGSQHGRWRDMSHRLTLLRELHASGLTKRECIRQIRERGDTINSSWIAVHARDLNWRKQKNPAAQVKPQPAKAKATSAKPEPIWSDEHTAKLIRLWLSGTSAQQISDIFGGPPFTRNAILGKLHRLRLANQLRVEVSS